MKPAEPAAEYRSARVEWTATVTRSQGAAPPPGTACKTYGELSGNGSKVRVNDLEVLCGGKVLYRSNDKFNGVSNRSSDVTESAGKAVGTLRNGLVFSDQGTRTGRSQISLDTANRQGVVWSDNIPTFRVEFRMEPWSLDRTGEPLIDPENRRESMNARVVRTGRVTKVNGSAPTTVGATCIVDVSPASDNQSNCRVRVRCGGALLYGDGGSGYNLCDLKDGRVLKANDPRSTAEDGDPALSLDFPENSVVVSEPQGDKLWDVNILLVP